MSWTVASILSKLVVVVPSILLLLFSPSPVVADDNLTFKVRLQPRADLGHFTAADSNSYSSRLDLYVRRSRLEIYGKPADGVSYVFVLAADRLRGSSSKTSAPYAYVNYQLSEATKLRFGLSKLPFIRQRLVSSSRQLLIDRSQPALTLSAAVGSYVAPHLSFQGSAKDGSLGYILAIADGLQPGEKDSKFSEAKVTGTAGPAFFGRLELSPGGWREGRQMESHLGEGRHLTFGSYAVVQNGIEVDGASEDRLLWGGDISLHRDGLVLQAEYLRLQRDGGPGAADSEPAGWYVQSGYFFSGLNLEPAGRIERYDANLPGGKDSVTTYVAGLNWYRQGHDLKFMLNLVHSQFQRNVRAIDREASRTMLQFQNQVYF